MPACCVVARRFAPDGLAPDVLAPDVLAPCALSAVPALQVSSPPIFSVASFRAPLAAVRAAIGQVQQQHLDVIEGEPDLPRALTNCRIRTASGPYKRYPDADRSGVWNNPRRS
jgi:hypothetical protein